MLVLMLISMLMSHASVDQWISLFCLLYYLVLMLMSLVRTRLYETGIAFWNIACRTTFDSR